MMSKLTDLEICKRIAEIDGVDYSFHKAVNALAYTDRFDEVLWYNPLTNDALCFQLFKRHNVNVNSHPQSPSAKWYTCQSIKNGKVSMCNDGFSNLKGDSDNKAICLAIIEAHKN